MKIVFLTRRAWPSIGGVEKHILEISKILIKKGHKVTVVCERENGQESKQVSEGIKYVRFNYPHTKLFGLITIWYKLHILRKVFHSADIIHIHDVFIWGIFIRLFAPHKKIYTTFHGGQDIWPIPLKNKIMVKIAHKYSNGTIVVGDFIRKHFGNEPDFVTYGGTKQKVISRNKKIKNTISWIGRLDENTDLPGFISWLKSNKNKFKVTFVGDGKLRRICEYYGRVTGFVSDPQKYLKTCEYAVPVGYLSYLEAKSACAKILTFPKTPIKKDYWKGIEGLSVLPTWKQVTQKYLELWKII